MVRNLAMVCLLTLAGLLPDVATSRSELSTVDLIMIDYRFIPDRLTLASLSLPEFWSLAELLETVVHNTALSCPVSLLWIALGVTYLMVARPGYTAVATMLIDSRRVPISWSNRICHRRTSNRFKV
jgi:hypothetical protein